MVFPDDGELREIFRGKQVEFGWRPDHALSHWTTFYQTLGSRRLSEVVTERLQEVGEFDATKPRFVTESAVKMIAAWLSEKREKDYERSLEAGTLAQLARLNEAMTQAAIQVAFRLRVDAIDESVTESRSVFWDCGENLLIYAPAVKRSQVAKAITRGLVTGQEYKDLAHWIELVLEAQDTDRLKDEGWSVPQPILKLFPGRPVVPASPAQEPPSEPALVTESAPTLDPGTQPAAIASHTESPADDAGVVEQPAARLDEPVVSLPGAAAASPAPAVIHEDAARRPPEQAPAEHPAGTAGAHDRPGSPSRRAAPIPSWNALTSERQSSATAS